MEEKNKDIDEICLKFIAEVLEKDIPLETILSCLSSINIIVLYAYARKDKAEELDKLLTILCFGLKNKNLQKETISKLEKYKFFKNN